MSEPQTMTIVVGADGSDHAATALSWAIDEAKLRGARLRIVTAWHVPALVYGTAAAAPILAEDYRGLAERVAAAAGDRARDAGVEVEARATYGQAAEALLEAAATADLLVVGSRGHGGFAGLLLGSVSAQCAHHAPCALVIVPSPRTH